MTATLTVGLSNFGAAPATGWRGLLELARAAESCGIDRLVVVDHVVMGDDTSQYVWGPFRFPPESPWLEPLTTLAALGAVTSSIRLATGILIAALRGPAVLAKTAATVDVLCDGRLDLGVGVGWQPVEYQAQGLDFDRRGELLDDALATCTALWAGSPAVTEVGGRRVEVWCEPRPVQPHGPPLWISGSLHERNLERLARFGSGWIPIMGATPSDIIAGVHRVHGALADAGRDSTTLQVRAPVPVVRDGRDRPSLEASLEAAAELVDAGVTDVHVTPAVFERVQASLPRFYEELRRSFDAIVLAR